MNAIGFDKAPTLLQLAARLGLEPHPPETLSGRLAARRAALFVADGLRASLTPAPRVRALFSVGLEVEGLGEAVIALPAAAARWLEGFGLDGRLLAREIPLARALLLEYALRDLFAGAEGALERRISVMETVPEDEMLSLGLKLEGADFAFTCSLRLAEPLAEELCERLERIAPPEAPDLGRKQVGLSVVAGRQLLSDAELDALEIGDVVMFDPEPPALRANDLLSAQISLETAMPRMESEFCQCVDPQPVGDFQPAFFVAGAARMPLEELARLKTGAPLPLAIDRQMAVILHRGQPRGRGRVIRLGQGQGLRVTELWPAAPDRNSAFIKSD